jgi:uncharacterized protein
MKFSKYNVFQPFEGKVLAYNSFSDQYMMLEPLLYELLDAAVQGDCADDLNDAHPSFYAALLQRGFMVNADENETQKVIDTIQKMDNDTEHFTLIINPTMNCNFKCWYCYETHIKDSKMGPETINSVCRFIDNLFAGNKGLKTFTISWFGGEPLLYFHKVIVPVLKYAKEKAAEHYVTFYSGLTTNAYLLNQEMIDVFKAHNITSIQITLDGNRELHNTIRFVSPTRGSYDEIINNIKLVCRNGINVTARINYTHKTLEGIRDIVKDFDDLTTEERNFISFSFHQVWQDKKSEATDFLATEIKETFADGLLHIDPPHQQAINFSCYADTKNEAVINYNGEVFKCTARNFSTENSEGRITADGNIEWNENNERRRAAKLSNKPCLECMIFPLCGGGCSQQAYENYGKDYCVYDFDENKKKELVKQRFLDTMALVPVPDETPEPATVD